MWTVDSGVPVIDEFSRPSSTIVRIIIMSLIVHILIIIRHPYPYYKLFLNHRWQTLRTERNTKYQVHIRQVYVELQPLPYIIYIYIYASVRT